MPWGRAVQGQVGTVSLLCRAFPEGGRSQKERWKEVELTCQRGSGLSRALGKREADTEAMPPECWPAGQGTSRESMAGSLSSCCGPVNMGQRRAAWTSPPPANGQCSGAGSCVQGVEGSTPSWASSARKRQPSGHRGGSQHGTHTHAQHTRVHTQVR